MNLTVDRIIFLAATRGKYVHVRSEAASCGLRLLQKYYPIDLSH